MMGGVNGVTTGRYGLSVSTNSKPVTSFTLSHATGAAVGRSQSKKSTSISLHPLSSLVQALSEYVHALIVWVPIGGFTALMAPPVSSPYNVYGANFSLRTSTPSTKNLTHLAVFSSQFAGVLLTVASMFKVHVEKSNKSTVGVKSVKIAGVTDVSITLKSSIMFEHTMVPVAATAGSVTRRVAMILYMIIAFWGRVIENERSWQTAFRRESFCFMRERRSKLIWGTKELRKTIAFYRLRRSNN